MDNFWDLSDGEDITKTGTQFEVGGGDIEPIPNNTNCTAIIDLAGWDTYMDGQKFISLRWSILAPFELKNRKIFHKLWVADPNPMWEGDVDSKRDKAKRMLVAIDQNAGGKLLKSGKMPSDEALQLHLTSVPMTIKVKTWESKDKTAKGNYIASVGPKNNVKPEPVKVTRGMIDDEVPF